MLYKEGRRSYTNIQKKDILLRDAGRDKELGLQVTFPGDEGVFPIIIWSHGLFGTKEDYSPLIDFWAENGYVCIRPEHSDSRALLKKKMNMNDPSALSDWRNRPKDVSFIMDSLRMIGELIPGFGEKVDAAKIGIGGHSYGAHTAQLVAGALVREPGASGYGIMSDLRPSVFLFISTQNLMHEFDGNSWSVLERPFMIITGTKDFSPRTNQPKFSRKEPFHKAPPGRKYLMVIENGYHNFGGISGGPGFPGAGPNNERHVNIVRSASLALWDSFLKGDSEALDYLESKKIIKDSGGSVRFDAK